MRALRAVLSPLGLGLCLITPARAAAQFMDNHNYSLVMLDQLEYRPGGPDRPVAWDGMGWFGGDFTRLWFKTEGAVETATGTWEGEAQVLYSRLVAPFWDFQAGARLEAQSSGGTTRTRGFLTVGLEGLAPYWFEVEPALFVSQDGDVSGRLTASYEMYLTQRLVAQPRMELNAALQSVPDFGVGSGMNDLDFGLRVRYEVRRQFAPYLGVQWGSKFSETATLARDEGEPVSYFTVVAGVRLWF